MAKVIELVMVTGDNNNKYYKMTEKNDGTWDAEWGRVGYAPQLQNYPMKQWRSKYNEKIKKGYKDITSLKIENEDDNVAYFEDNSKSTQFLKMLQDFATNAIKENYTISSQSVTLNQVNAAQDIIASLGKSIKKLRSNDTIKTLDPFNNNLIELYTTIPRKMRNVKNHLANNYTDAVKILSDEQDLLDVMRQQVEMYLSTKNVQTKDHIDLASTLGITIESIYDDKLISMLKNKCGSDSNRVRDIYKIENAKTSNAFKKYIDDHAFDKTTKMLFHGSRNQNWINILKTGLLIKPDGVITTGSMYGNGIYFADKAIKSIGYTSLSGSYWVRGDSSKGFIAFYDVATGKELEHMHHQSWMYSLNHKVLMSHGKYDSFFAKGGADLRNNEYIVYRPDQCTIKYILELN